MSAETDKVWFVRSIKELPHLLCENPKHYMALTQDGKERMTEIEAIHAASVLNERDRGRGVTWVAAEAK